MASEDGRIGNTRGEFSVCLFFLNGEYEYVRRWVSPEEAVYAFQVYTQNPASRVGVIRRVIVTDGGDCTNREWKYGEGVVFPPS
jgi:hypothetical protein